MKTTLLVLPLVLALSSCASFQDARVADYNGDGVISDAEARQFAKTQDVERNKVITEELKVQHAGSTVRTGTNMIRDLSGAYGTLRNFGRWY